LFQLIVDGTDKVSYNWFMVDNKVFGWYAMTLTAVGVLILSMNKPYDPNTAQMGFLINCIGCIYWTVYSLYPTRQTALLVMNVIMLAINLIGVYNN